jgi:hypothetical protein
MLKGDVSKLAVMCNCSKSTIYNVAEKLGIDLHPIHHRCDKTVDSSQEKLSPMSKKNGLMMLSVASSNIVAKRKNEQNATK